MELIAASVALSGGTSRRSDSSGPWTRRKPKKKPAGETAKGECKHCKAIIPLNDLWVTRKNSTILYCECVDLRGCRKRRFALRELESEPKPKSEPVIPRSERHPYYFPPPNEKPEPVPAHMIFVPKEPEPEPDPVPEPEPEPDEFVMVENEQSDERDRLLDQFPEDDSEPPSFFQRMRRSTRMTFMGANNRYRRLCSDEKEKTE